MIYQGAAEVNYHISRYDLTYLYLWFDFHPLKNVILNFFSEHYYFYYPLP